MRYNTRLFYIDLNIIIEHNQMFHITLKPRLSLWRFFMAVDKLNTTPAEFFFFYKGPASTAKEYNIPRGHGRGKYVRYVPRVL